MKIEDKIYRNHVSRIYDAEKSLERLLTVIIQREIKGLNFDPVACEKLIKDMFERIVSLTIDKEVEDILTRLKQTLKNRINE
jgi:hypothetical protein